MKLISSLSAWLRKRSPRMLIPGILAVILLAVVVALAPHQAPVLMYKQACVALSGCYGYLFDVAAFPYAQPSGYLRFDWREVDSFEDNQPDFGIVPGCEWLFLVACLRRAAIVCTCMMATSLAL